jgi:energy-coupling factor transporter ATP-binding protein EcfA2
MGRIAVVMVIGQTGSGKSTFATMLTVALRNATGMPWPVGETGHVIAREMARIICWSDYWSAPAAERPKERGKYERGFTAAYIEAVQKEAKAPWRLPAKEFGDWICSIDPTYLARECTRAGARIVAGCRRQSEVAAWNAENGACTLWVRIRARDEIENLVNGYELNYKSCYFMHGLREVINPRGMANWSDESAEKELQAQAEDVARFVVS